MATRDFVRSELRSLLEELEERSATSTDATAGDDREPARATAPAPTGAERTRRGPRAGARPRWSACLTPHCPAVTPCSRRCRRSTTPRSASRSPSSAWSSRSRSTTPARCAVDDLADRLRLPDEGHADHATRPRRCSASPASPRVDVDARRDERRAARRAARRSCAAAPPRREIPFAKPGSLTRVYAVASGKGGVGKSSVTVNLAAAMAAEGLRVGRRRRRRLRLLGAAHARRRAAARPRSTT